MEPPDSFVGRVAPEAEVVAALRRIGEGRERLVAVKDGIGVVDVMGHPETYRSPDLKRREWLALEGPDVYHNHPPDEDGTEDDQSFSTSDAAFARTSRPRTMVVVTQRSLFRLSCEGMSWRRCLGKGRNWRREFDRIYGHALWAFEDPQESLHRAWESFCSNRGLAYSREEG